MAIARIKKLSIIAHNSIRESLLDILQGIGVVHISLIKEAPERNFKKEGIKKENISIKLSHIDELIKYLNTLEPKKGGFLGERISLRLEEFKNIYKIFDYSEIYEGFKSLTNSLKEVKSQKEKLLDRKRKLSPWKDLTIAPLEIEHLSYTNIILGTINHKDLLNITEQLDKDNLTYNFEIINTDKDFEYLVFVYLRRDETAIGEILKRSSFNRAYLEIGKSSIEEELVYIDSESQNLGQKENFINEKLKNLLKYKSKLMCLYDYYLNLKRKIESEENFLNTKETFLIQGWIKERNEKLLRKTLEKDFKHLELDIQNPGPDEIVPVELDNKPLVMPFEFITRIYGMPKYEEVDPTPFLAPFFFLYFGFCVSDAGYGILLALTCLFILKKFRLGPMGLRFFRLFFFCGISTIIIGALTGSWFGNMFDILAEANKVFLPLKRFKDNLVLIDPLTEPTKLLGIALSMGIFQVWFGNIVAGIGNLKNKRYLNILFDQFSMLTFLFGLTGLGLVFLKAMDETRINLFKYTTIAGAIALILTQGRSEKGIGSKLFYGVYNLYNAFSGYLSDILSYSRLWALGLVTGVMANTINLISVQFSQIVVSSIPFLDKITLAKVIVGTVILILLFISGHIIAFLMNLLGAFVHPLRLQFVEFFSKFFKAGGSSFKPLKVETKYINIT
ncbi:MAG: V-type ATP synthase subunit I [Candidatus Omnitrophica bacterium]|nr:V-type ATP synthase subunit I [Candidatus Omnitrophota bacterium]